MLMSRPMNDEFFDLVATEEAKRNRHITPRQKWETFQQLLNWTESLPTGRRNTKEACLREQERLLAGLETWRATQQS